jgi:hypothetical protein
MPANSRWDLIQRLKGLNNFLTACEEDFGAEGPPEIRHF